MNPGLQSCNSFIKRQCCSSIGSFRMNITLHFFIFPVDVHFSQPLSALLDVLNNQGLAGWENNLYYSAVFMGFTQNFGNQQFPRPWVEK